MTQIFCLHKSTNTTSCCRVPSIIWINKIRWFFKSNVDDLHKKTKSRDLIFNSNYISSFFNETNYIRNLTFLHKNIWVVIQLFEKSYILLNSLMSNFLVSKIFKLISYRIFEGKADIAIKKVKYLCLHHVDWSKSKFCFVWKITFLIDIFLHIAKES